MTRPLAIFLEALGVTMIVFGIVYDNIPTVILGAAAILGGYFGYRKRLEKLRMVSRQEAS